jgi:putative PIG3 family NAD(P)H quinone oxidoreductase
MKAIKVDGERLEWTDVPDVSAGVGEVLIQVRATAINRADLAQRRGGYPPPAGASAILGLECAGEIVALGEGVGRYRVGDRVCALLAGGGYAEFVNVPAGQVLPMPRGLDFEQSAALPEVFATAYLNLYMEAALQPAERVLLHAGASGVGTAAIQLCKAFGNPCFVTAGSDEKIQRCIALGAAGGANRHTQRFVEKVAEWTGRQGVDVILDPVGAPYLSDNLRSLSADGRLVVIGLMGGNKADLEIGLMMVKRLRVIGSTLRARSVAAKSAVMDALARRLWPLIERGDVVPVVDRVLPVEQADDAHLLMAGNDTFGKIVLRVGG